MSTFRPETAENPVSVTAAIQAAGRIDRDLEFLLGPKGPIAQGMPGWQDRPQQRQAAQAIRRAWKQRLHALVEAGTGTGKSCINVVVAAIHALETKKPVVISTGSLPLQAQYCEKDLPQLQALLTPWLEQKFGRTFTFAKQLGRGNYLCVAKPAHPELENWETEDGDLSGFPLSPGVRPMVTASREECAGSRCRHADECWFMQAKRQVRAADVVIINHALLMRSLLAVPGTVLPVYDACIIDEAHHLQEEATKLLALEVSPGNVSRLAARALKFCGEHRQGALGFDEPAPTRSIHNYCDPNWPCNPDQCGDDCTCACHDEEMERERVTTHSPTQEAIDAELRQLFHALTHLHRSQANEGVASLKPLEHTDAGNHLDELCAHLRRLAVDVENAGALHWEESAEATQAVKLGTSLRDLAHQLTTLRTPKPGRVDWLQMGEQALHSQPIDVADFLKDSLWKAPCALSSATLATGTGDHAFDYLQESLGIRTLHQVVAGSPFRWEKQAWLYLPEDGNLEANVAPANREEYARVQALHILEVMNFTKGRFLCLFTSQKGLDLTLAALLKKGMMWPYIQQGEMSKPQCLDFLRSTPGAVLFGLSSFFEGVDIQGAALSGVYLDRLPFPVPSDLLWQARIERAGGGPGAFSRLIVPRAITITKQVAGRLIRGGWDRGILMLGDPRLQTKKYGAAILDALPPARRVHRPDLRRLPLFLAGAGVPCEGPAEVAAALQGLTLEGMPREHAAIVVRLREMLPCLTPGLWSVGEKLVLKYGRNVSETI